MQLAAHHKSQCRHHAVPAVPAVPVVPAVPIHQSAPGKMLASVFATSKLVPFTQLACVSIVQVHERTLQGDFLMALLRDLVISRRTDGNPLKVNLPRLALPLPDEAAVLL